MPTEDINGFAQKMSNSVLNIGFVISLDGFIRVTYWHLISWYINYDIVWVTSYPTHAPNCQTLLTSENSESSGEISLSSEYLLTISYDVTPLLRVLRVFPPKLQAVKDFRRLLMTKEFKRFNF